MPKFFDVCSNTTVIMFNSRVKAVEVSIYFMCCHLSIIVQTLTPKLQLLKAENLVDRLIA